MLGLALGALQIARRAVSLALDGRVELGLEALALALAQPLSLARGLLERGPLPVVGVLVVVARVVRVGRLDLDAVGRLLGVRGVDERRRLVDDRGGSLVVEAALDDDEDGEAGSKAEGAIREGTPGGVGGRADGAGG